MSAVALRNCTVVGGPGAGGIEVGSAGSLRGYSVLLDELELLGIDGVGIDAFASGGDHLFVKNCRAVSCGTGFLLGGPTTEAYGLLAEGCQVGLGTHANPTVIRTLLRHNDVGLRIEGALGDDKPTFEQMEVVANRIGVRVRPGGDCHFNDSHLLDNEEFAVRVERGCPGGVYLDFRNCWWGPEATEQMKQSKNVRAIWDVYDDASLCEVDYGGFLLGPVVDAPIVSAAVRDLRVTPNPFRRATRIAYDLDRESAVTVAVFDVSGRLVSVIDRGPRLVGSHSVRWDGTASSGLAAGAGVYFVRVSSDGQWETTRIVLLR